MTDALRTTIEEWNTAASVIAVLITGIVTLVGGFILWFKTGPVTRSASRAAARASDATAWKMAQDGSFGLIDRLETRLAATERKAEEAEKKAEVVEKKAEDAEAAAHQASQQIGVLRQEHAAMEEELHEIRRRYDALREWVNRIISNWSTVRQNEDPPDVPNEH